MLILLPIIRLRRVVQAPVSVLQLLCPKSFPHVFTLAGLQCPQEHRSRVVKRTFSACLTFVSLHPILAYQDVVSDARTWFHLFLVLALVDVL